MIGIYQQEGLDFFNQVKEALKNYINLPAQFESFFKIPTESFNPLRNQYEADKIIEKIALEKKKQFDFHIIIVDVDIYARGMNFIFGQAEPLKRTAIISIHRLFSKNINERLAKEVVHEMGHLLDLGHCANPKCVMYFSNTIADTDMKDANFCEECRRGIGKL